MNKALRAALVALALVGGTIVATASPATAATYTVTSSACLGPGTLADAISQANANPGADTINLTVNVDDWYLASCGLPANRRMPVRITGAVTINGNGHSILSSSTWIAGDGSVNNTTICPKNQPGVMFLSDPSGGFEIGAPSTDNTGVDVTINDLTMDGLLNMAVVNDKATLKLDAVQGKNIMDTRSCNNAAIEAGDGAGLTVTDSKFSKLFNWAPTIGAAGVGVISGGGAANLTISKSSFENNLDAGAVMWLGNASSTVNIVSSQFANSGGVSIIGGPGPVTANIVNSAFGFSNFYPPDHIVASGDATVNLTASTISASSSKCEGQTYQGQCAEPYGVLGVEGGGVINLVQSAVGVADPDGATRPNDVVAGGTGFTADASSYVSPVAVQDAAALQTKFSQPSLITGTPALPTIADPAYYDTFVSSVTPLLGTSGTPGVLLDVIADSTCGGANKLVNPIDASCITQDVFGNSRWDTGNSKRNIGAVQLSLSPHIQVTAIGDQFVSVGWTQPLNPESGNITGYGLFYRPVGSGSWTRIDISGPTTLNKKVTGLTNGTAYEFKVVGVNVVGDGPDSNTVVGTPLGTIATPAPTATPSTGTVSLTWPVPNAGGRSIASYSVVYRPYGSSTWISGGTVTSPSATVSGLTNGQKYEFGVSAIASDGTSSDLGTTTGTPSTVLPLRIKGARPASSSLPKSGRTRVVGSATTSSAGRVKTTVRCRVTSTSGRGDMGFCTYTVRSNGRVTVTTLGHRGVVVTVTQQAVPKKGKTGYTSSAKWVRSWRAR